MQNDVGYISKGGSAVEAKEGDILGLLRTAEFPGDKHAPAVDHPAPAPLRDDPSLQL